MAERGPAESWRELLWPLLFVVASTVVTATVYLSLLGAPLVILSSMALGGVLDRRREASRGASRRSVAVWSVAAGVSVAWVLLASALAIADRIGSGIDEGLMTGAVAAAFLVALPAGMLSVPAFVASIRAKEGWAVSSWPFVAGWALIVLTFVFGVFCLAALFVDERRPAIATAGGAMVAWSIAAARANARR